jgi:hypothetical protein
MFVGHSLSFWMQSDYTSYRFFSLNLWDKCVYIPDPVHLYYVVQTDFDLSILC